MSGAKEVPSKLTSDDVDPFLESVVRSASDRAPEPQTSVRPAKRVAKTTTPERKGGATKTASSEVDRAWQSTLAGAEEVVETDSRLMERVEAKLRSTKAGMSRSVTVRMPVDLYDRLTDKAWKIGERSLSRFVITVLQEATKNA